MTKLFVDTDIIFDLLSDKKTFSLKTGECLSGDECAIKTYPVKVEDGKVFIGV